MRKLLLIAMTAGMACWIGCRDNRKEDPFDKDIHEWLFTAVNSLEKSADSLLTASKGNNTATEVQRIFTRCRKQYKRLEWFSEYYAPATSRSLNGPPLPEIEIEENKKTDPAGLQVIEELLYPYDTGNVHQLDKEIRTFISALIPLRHTVENTRFDTAHVFDACRQELTRIISLGITGFDTPLCGEGITEAAVSLQGIREIWEIMAVPAEVLNKTDSAMTVCRKKEDFDYAGFIVRHINPLSVALTNWFYREGLTQLKYPGALNYSAATMFDSAAFNTGFFVHAAELESTPEKVALGKALFSNEQLAGNGKRSCGSCHQQDKAFTDGLARNTALNGRGEIARNTPTLLYAGLQQSQFYDMRSPTLENQVMDVLHNTNEMHSSPEAVAAWLNRTPGMKDTFRRVFQGMKDSIMPRHVMQAIAAYVRQLHPFRSEFDYYMRGDLSAMNAQEVKGMNIFMGKARCATCHFLPLFNGTAPPSFSNTEAEVLGVLRKPGIPELDTDPGRYAHTKMEELQYAFKTPTLRNIALTGPYMHNGAYRTLEEVMDFYDKGGAAGYGIDLPNQTLSPDPLHLSHEEKQAVIAFMKTLTDK